LKFKRKLVLVIYIIFMRLQNLLVATLQTVTLGLLAREQRRFAGKHYTHYQG
jgi:hypothetical protein